jgi:hypothetical protein
MTILIERDEELASLLGHTPSQPTWKPKLFLIAQYREETERLAHIKLKEELMKTREELARASKKAADAVRAEPTRWEGLGWVLSVIALRLNATTSINLAMADADDVLAGYKKRFGDGSNT